jgi:hypothetical protein
LIVSQIAKKDRLDTKTGESKNFRARADNLENLRRQYQFIHVQFSEIPSWLDGIHQKRGISAHDADTRNRKPSFFTNEELSKFLSGCMQELDYRGVSHYSIDMKCWVVGRSESFAKVRGKKLPPQFTRLHNLFVTAKTIFNPFEEILKAASQYPEYFNVNEQYSIRVPRFGAKYCHCAKELGPENF